MAVWATANKSLGDLFIRDLGRLGAIKMTDSTTVIDAVEYEENGYYDISDLHTADIRSFLDGLSYTAYAYGEKDNNKAYPFVIVTEAPAPYNKYTNFAVCKGTPSRSIDSGIGGEKYRIEAYYNSAEYDDINIFFADDDTTGTNPMQLATGDVIVFNADQNRNIKDLQKISGWNNINDFDEIRYNALNGISPIYLSSSFTDISDEWESTAGIDDAQEINRLIRRDKVTIAFGPIIEASPNHITLGVINDGKTTNDVTGTYDIFITNETNAYLYDYAKATKVRLEPASAISIPYCPPYTDNNNVIDWSAEENESVCFAFVLVSDGEAKDIFVLEPR